MKNKTGNMKTHSERVIERARRLMGGEVLLGRPDPEGLQELIRISFPGEDVSDPRYITYLYDQNPRGRAIEFITRNKGLVTGHCAAIPLLFKIGPARQFGSIALNAITHPDYRGRGIFIILHEAVSGLCARNGLDFTFGFANTNSEKGCLRHLHYYEVGRFPLWILPFDLPKMIAARNLKAGIFWRIAALAANPFWNMATTAFRPRSKSHSLTLHKISECGPEFDAFWDEVKTDYMNIQVRDRDFLSWRFVRHPTRRYDIYVARRNGRLAGYLVGTLTDLAGLRWGMIVDILVANSAGGRSAAKHLAATFARRARAEGAALAGSLMLAHGPAAAGLRRNGFFVCPKSLLPREFPVLLRWNRPEPVPEKLLDPKSWHLTLGDYDAI